MAGRAHRRGISRSRTETTRPVRTCIGCRVRRADHELVRVAVVEGDLLIDTRGHGRGAWLCPNESCVDAAARSKAFSRALRTKLADAVFADTLLGWLGKSVR